jgi:hypothetical protein
MQIAKYTIFFLKAIKKETRITTKSYKSTSPANNTTKWVNFKWEDFSPKSP